MPAIARQLHYGADGRFDVEVPQGIMRGTHHAPAPLDDIVAATTAAIREPLEYPALREAVVPGDRVVIALQPNLPRAADIIAAIWTELDSRGVEAADVTILQAARLNARRDPDPRQALPDSVAEAVSWRTHDATDESALAYLATSSTGERIYLAKDLCDADFVLPVGLIEYDAVLGYQGTAGGLFPALSNLDAIKRHGAVAHAELTPDDSRQARVIADEVGWLLGTQFVVQAIRGAGGGLSRILAGLAEPVLQQGKELLREGWRLELPDRADVVLATVDAGPTGTTWADLAAAAAAASNLVQRGGRVVLLSDLKSSRDSIGDALAILRESASLAEARAVLTQLKGPDQPDAMRLLGVLDRCEVFVLSNIADGVPEELFLQSLGDENEVRRLLLAADSIVLLEGGQHLETRIGQRAIAG